MDVERNACAASGCQERLAWSSRNPGWVQHAPFMEKEHARSKAKSHHSCCTRPQEEGDAAKVPGHLLQTGAP